MDPWNNINVLNFKQLKQLQNERLHHFINTHVYPFSPHYQQVFNDYKINPKKIRCIEDLKDLPFSTKADLMTKENPEKYKDFILQPDLPKMKRFWPKVKLLDMAAESLIYGKQKIQENLGREYRPIFMTFTTGTTSWPVAFLYSRYDLDNLNLSGNRMLKLFDIKPDERIMNIFPFAPHLAFWQVFFGAIEGGVFALSTGGGKVMGTEGNLIAMSRIKPSVILGVPSYIYHMIRCAKEKNQDLSYLKKIVLGAGKVTVHYKQKIADMLSAQGAKDVRIFGTYGFTEARSAWAECPAENSFSSGYHLYPDKEIIEIIDPETGALKGLGEDGEIVYTSIDSRASVVLRYRTGDYVKGGIVYEPCPYCGRLTLRLASDISRLSDSKDLQLSKVKGTLVNLNHFGNVLNDIAEVDEWQIEIRKHNNDPYEVDEVVVYITPKANVQEDACAVMIKDKIIGATEIAPNEIKFIPLCDMIKKLELETANKEKRILDVRPKG